ncbi:hypothetical protein DPMN_096628 [Dreissena polymorpha]|uniref:Uncharacterized protein n=1 Tax=Dreissena polymorpha TaxID=45954 RepID=A0A9D4LA79_DREPO|nr:hypothetical protein DPMN_096628 [Dreissena polymorpha]
MGQRQGIPSHWGEGGECGRPGQYPHTGVRGNEWGKRQGIPSYWGERDEWGRPGPYPHTEVRGIKRVSARTYPHTGVME